MEIKRKVSNFFGCYMVLVESLYGRKYFLSKDLCCVYIWRYFFGLMNGEVSYYGGEWNSGFIVLKRS